MNKYIIEICKYSGKVGKLYEVGDYGTGNMKYKCQCCHRIQLKPAVRIELKNRVDIFH